MRFSIAVNMERIAPTQPMQTVIDDALELVKIADQGGFEVAWAAEHHCIELNVAPNPFMQLMHWAMHTKDIRLGTAVVSAPYWHPIKLAGEAGLFDLYSDGRLELGLGRGAFQYEFNRMADGIPHPKGGVFLREMLPLLKGLWEGDMAHQGECWSFPTSTALPKPLQKPHPPIWVAARGPETFDWAFENGLNIMSTPLSKPMAEVEDLARRFNETHEQHPKVPRPRWLVLRRACVYDRPEDWRAVAETEYGYARRFAGLFQTDGEVVKGFPLALPEDEEADHELALEQIRENMVFGTPDEVVAKLKGYEALGCDLFCYGANFDLPHATARRSLELFVEQVMPHFTEQPAAAAGGA